MKSTKKIISAAAALCMAYSAFMCAGETAFTCTPILNASAAEDSSEELSLEYSELDDGTIEITKYISSSSADIVIPSEIDGKMVTRIGDYAFYDCKNLTSIIIPDSVTSIGNFAFHDCNCLTSINIPNGVKSIGYMTFYSCKCLASITIPDSVTSIGEDAFIGCKSLASITVSENNKNYSSTDGVLFNKDKSELILYPKGRLDDSYTIPDSATSICEGAFGNCESLTSITIPDSVTSIGDSAFFNCFSLTSIIIPDSVTSIGEYAFGYCRSLASITIPDSVTSIGEIAFWDCESLTSISIPKSVENIGDEAFGECSSLTSITVSENNKNYSSIDGILFNKEKSELIRYPRGKSDDSYIVPDGVISIEKYAFNYCDSLTSISIPRSVENIGYEAFCECSSLTSITILNPNCEIFDSPGTISNGYERSNYDESIWVPYFTGTIYGYAGSNAQAYAENYDRKFVAISDVEGDINCNGAFDVSDMVNLQNWLMNRETEIVYWKNGDLNNDNILDSFDIVLMRKLLIENSSD